MTEDPSPGRPILLAGTLLLAAGSASSQNLLTNPGFEAGLSPWIGSGSSLQLLSTQTFDGAFAARAINRSNWTSGHRGVITGLHPSGTVLLFTGAMRLDGPSQERAQVKIRYEYAAGGSESFLVAPRSGDQGDWFTLRGIHQLDYTGQQPDLKLQLQTRNHGEDISADAFAVEVYEEDPDWLQLANAGIEQHRRRDMTVRVVDVHGEPVGGVLDLRQVRHRFAFGATIEAPELEDNNVPYMDMFPTLFEWATPRNALKWRQTEANRDVLTWTRPDLVVQFCEPRGIPIYGHNIFWGVEDRTPDWVPPLDNNRLFDEMTERLDDLLGRYADSIDYWDVNNEMLHGTYYEGRYGTWIRDWMFEESALRDPSATLFLNDYNVVGGGQIGPEAESYFDHTLDFISRGVPVGGIGAQCHFDDGPIIAKWLRDRIDVLAAVGLPIRLTEFDVVRPDVNVRADDLEKFFRVAFSHPSVEGITFWGWWAGNHGKGPDAAIVDNNFAINAAGQRYLDLLDEWTTSDSQATGRDGEITARGYHGDYTAALTAAGYAADLGGYELVPGPDPQVVMLTAIGDCIYDIDANGQIDFFDTIGFLRLFDTQDPRADLDGSGDLTAADIHQYLNDSAGGCP